MSLQQALEELEQTASPHKRGSLFESFIADLLEQQGFDVTVNPKIATPRQTDLCAQRSGLFFIVEAKWQKKMLHIGDVSAVYDRLRQTTADVFACVFSMSGYAKSAEKYVDDHRSKEVLLFNGAEIRGIVAGELSFADLLHRKRDEIRKNAKSWFSDWNPKSVSTHLSFGQPEILRINDQSAAWWLSPTQGDEVIFAREALDLGGYSDLLVSLRLRREIDTPEELQLVLRMIRTHLGLAGRESFAIHQRTAGWYGSGIANFVTAIKQRKQRYDELNWPSYHHSEELAYFDRVEYGGLMGLTLRRRIGEGSYLYSCNIEILMAGLPVKDNSQEGSGRL